MKLTDDWFTAFSSDDAGNMVTVYGRDGIMEFVRSGKFKERMEITWKYEGGTNGMPADETAELMERMETALRKVMEKDKLAILTSVYTGGNEKIWVFYTRTARVFGEYLNKALGAFELLPISVYAEVDPDWEEYLDMYEMKQWAVD